MYYQNVRLAITYLDNELTFLSKMKKHGVPCKCFYITKIWYMDKC